jgi:hypothetical protein
LWTDVAEVPGHDGEDRFHWKWNEKGVYTSSSAYRAFFHGTRILLGGGVGGAGGIPSHHSRWSSMLGSPFADDAGPRTGCFGVACKPGPSTRCAGARWNSRPPYAPMPVCRSSVVQGGSTLGAPSWSLWPLAGSQSGGCKWCRTLRRLICL